MSLTKAVNKLLIFIWKCFFREILKLHYIQWSIHPDSSWLLGYGEGWYGWLSNFHIIGSPLGVSTAWAGQSLTGSHFNLTLQTSQQINWPSPQLFGAEYTFFTNKILTDWLIEKLIVFLNDCVILPQVQRLSKEAETFTKCYPCYGNPK